MERWESAAPHPMFTSETAPTHTGRPSLRGVRRAWVPLLVLLASGTLIDRAEAAAGAQGGQGFVDRVFRDSDGEHRYVVFVPREYREDRAWPVILFLHGAGERGTDGRRHLEVGLGVAVRARQQQFPFIAVFPQCEDLEIPARQGWLPGTADGRRALAILDEVERTYRTDRDRVYLTGMSMGGFGAWAHANESPGRWAAVVPICGGGDPKWASALAALPIWCFHGTEDRAVPPAESREMIEAMRRAGGSPRYTEYPGVAHNAWDPAYTTDELYSWLLEQRRVRRPSAGRDGAGAGSAGPATARPTTPQTPGAQPEAPFVPTLEIPRAVYARFGRDMLAALADSLPHLVTPDMLSGRLADASHVTSTQGRTFNVMLRNLSYRGRLSRAVIEPISADRIGVTLSVRNLNIVVGRTEISGEGRSAVCGPLTITLGHRRDLPVYFEVQPVVDRRQLRLRLLATRFRLPADNWTVGYPAWVNASGLGMTQDRVASGLQSGLTNDPGRIEREVAGAVPRILAQFENRMAFDQVTEAVAGLWPLPVYRPRLRAWPSEVQTDVDGVTLVLGITAAAIDAESAPQQPRVVDLPSTGRLGAGGRGFALGLPPALMEPLSAQVVDANAGRVNVLDTPMRRLADLADMATLSEIIPDLRGRGDTEVRAELVLAEPLLMRRVDGEAAGAIEFELPRVLCLIGLRPRAAGQRWTPYAEFEFRLRQVAYPELARPTPSRRALAVLWQGDAEFDVRARFAEGVSPTDDRIDTDRVRDILAAGWKEWTESGPLAHVPVEDIDLRLARLRAGAIGWEGSYLATTFVPAGLGIRNLTDTEVEYEMRGPYSEWGGPYRLGPDKSHAFDIATAVTCRFRVGGKPRVYTLPAGSHFEFRSTGAGGVDLFASREDP